LIIYTAISNGYDALKEPVYMRGKANQLGNIKLIAFLDEKTPYKGGIWETRRLETGLGDSMRDSKKAKVLVHRLFPWAEYSLWVDGSLSLLSSFDFHNLCKVYLAKTDIAVFRHPKRRCLYTEADVCKDSGLDDPEIIESQMRGYRRDEYPKNNGLTENSVILRRHSSGIKELNEMWWDEICKGSRRDQLSFNYVIWKLKMQYSILPGSGSHNPFSRSYPHLRSGKYVIL
jgi:hypothetical protein